MTQSPPASDDYLHLAVDVSQLRWQCDPDQFDFQTTHEVEPFEGVVGQESAVEALRFGLEVNAAGQNIFVRGLTGTGRSTLLRGLLESIRPDCRLAPDRLYVHNFESPDRPTLLTLPRGEGHAFRTGLEQVTQFIGEELQPELASDAVRGRAGRIERKTAAKVEAIGGPFDAELREAGLTLVTVQMGNTPRPMILPLIEGEPAGPDKLEELRKAGAITEEGIEQLQEKIGVFSQRLEELGEKIHAMQLERREALRELMQKEAKTLLERAVAPLRRRYPEEKVGLFLDAIVNDVLTNRLAHLEQGTAFTAMYEANLVQCHEPDEPCPVEVENTPSTATLIGSLDRPLTQDGETLLPHMMVRPGSLVRADGGFLILEARDLLAEPGGWRALIRSLRSGEVELVPPEMAGQWRGPVVKPEPIPIHVKVVLLGDAQLYYALDAMDPDFPNLFKVLADFDTVVERDATALGYYAGVIARIAREESLPPFHRTAVAALAEHGARIAAQPNRLTVRFGRLADIAREAAFLASKTGQGEVTNEHVREAVRRTKRRADLPARKFRRLVAEGTIRVQTRGEAVGQVNGLAVIQAGPLTYGFPTRITASIGPGTGGAINIEREAELSGAIHNKGFYILGGLLRNLLRTVHPLTFDASIAFEQSYGGIDGDSASGAEICCLLSALTGLPLSQDLAMTGAIDQMGNILPIGAVNEKIEGYFDTCKDAGLSGAQGVIIPKANVGDLMLRPDVVAACAEGQFRVHAVDTIHEALGLFTGKDPGHRVGDELYAEASVLGQAVARARDYYEMALNGARPVTKRMVEPA